MAEIHETTTPFSVAVCHAVNDDLTGRLIDFDDESSKLSRIFAARTRPLPGVRYDD